MIRLLCLVLLAAGMASTSAVAQTQRTFVSTTGDDANTASSCSAVTPCRSFKAALKVTRSGGEIVPLTSGGYGPVKIDQSVQIAAPIGVYAAVTTTSLGDGIEVSAAVSDTVVLRGLTLNGLGIGGSGVKAKSFGTLHIENCIITGFTSDGITVYPTSNASVFINDTIVRNNATNGASFQGSSSSSYYPTLNVATDNSRFENNAAEGIYVTEGAAVVATRTTSMRNAHNGFYVYAQAQNASLACDGCNASYDGLNCPAIVCGGFLALGPNASMHVARSTATAQNVGFAQAGSAKFVSLSGTNLVSNNIVDTSGTITPRTTP